MFAEFRGAPLFLLCLVDILVSFILVYIPTFVKIFFTNFAIKKKIFSFYDIQSQQIDRGCKSDYVFFHASVHLSTCLDCYEICSVTAINIMVQQRARATASR